MNYFLAGATGVLAGVFLSLLLLHTSPIWFEKDEVIVWKTDSGIVCHKIDTYSQINCELLKEAIGPRKQAQDEVKIED